MTDIDEKLEEIAQGLGVETEEIEERFNRYRAKYDNEDKAYRKVHNEAKRRKQRLDAMNEYVGFILGTSESRDVSTSDNVQAKELYVKNAIGVTEEGQPFRATLWGKAATHLTLPERVKVKFNGNEQDDSTSEVLSLVIPEETVIDVLEEKEESFGKFEKALEPFETDLKNLEEHYEDGNDLAYLQADVLALKGMTNNGARVVTIDDCSGFSEDYSTTVFVPENKARRLQEDSEVKLIGSLWKPDTKWDPVRRERIDEPGRVTVTAFGIEEV